MSCLLTKIDRLSVLLKILHVLSTVSSSITLILKHICVPMQSIRKQFINNAKLKQINLTLKKKKELPLACMQIYVQEILGEYKKCTQLN